MAGSQHVANLDEESDDSMHTCLLWASHGKHTAPLGEKKGVILGMDGTNRIELGYQHICTKFWFHAEICINPSNFCTQVVQKFERFQWSRDCIPMNPAPRLILLLQCYDIIEFIRHEALGTSNATCITQVWNLLSSWTPIENWPYLSGKVDGCLFSAMKAFGNDQESPVIRVHFGTSHHIVSSDFSNGSILCTSLTIPT